MYPRLLLFLLRLECLPMTRIDSIRSTRRLHSRPPKESNKGNPGRIGWTKSSWRSTFQTSWKATWTHLLCRICWSWPLGGRERRRLGQKDSCWLSQERRANLGWIGNLKIQGNKLGRIALTSWSSSWTKYCWRRLSIWNQNVNRARTLVFLSGGIEEPRSQQTGQLSYLLCPWYRYRHGHVESCWHRWHHLQWQRISCHW